MRPIDVRRFSPSGSWWRIHPGAALGRGRLLPDSDDADGATRADLDRNRKYAEWTSFAISSAIVLGLLALVIYRSISDEERGASISVAPIYESSWNSDGMTYIPIQIANTGTASASDVRVVVAPSDATAPTEILLDVLAGGASLEAVVGFTAASGSGQLQVQSLSYLIP